MNRSFQKSNRTPALVGLLQCCMRGLALGLVAGTPILGSELPAAAEFRKNIQPILEEHCADCHADGAKKGGVAFDEFKTDEAVLEARDLWVHALKNVRNGM